MTSSQQSGILSKNINTHIVQQIRIKVQQIHINKTNTHKSKTHKIQHIHIRYTKYT